jgi:UrcA family protein
MGGPIREFTVRKLALTIALGLAAVSGTAFADSLTMKDQTTVVTVPVSASDVSDPAAAGALLSRLGVAAMEACGAYQGSLREYRLTIQRSACYREKLDTAVAQVDSPLVSRLYDERGPLMVASLR